MFTFKAGYLRDNYYAVGGVVKSNERKFPVQRIEITNLPNYSLKTIDGVVDIGVAIEYGVIKTHLASYSFEKISPFWQGHLITNESKLLAGLPLIEEVLFFNIDTYSPAFMDISWDYLPSEYYFMLKLEYEVKP